MATCAALEIADDVGSLDYRDEMTIACSDKTCEENLQEQQDEVMALESIFPDTFSILNHPDQNQNNEYSVQLDVPVHLADDGIVLEVWAPEAERENCARPEVAAGMSPSKRPSFLRSQSGLRWHTSMHLRYVSPMRLHVILPKYYPLDGPPLFTLSCMWLDSGSLSVLCHQLDDLWQQQQGEPILFTWADWLQNTSLSHLDMTETIVLKSQQLEDGPRDPRALPECSNLADGIINILRYNQRQEWMEFTNTTQECGICFDSKPGSEFFRLYECDHHFCQDCLLDFCVMHVKEGTVQQLRCPDHECKSSIPPGIVRELLGEEAYQRWERLLLQHALDTMGDTVWCPRCNNLVVKEPQDELGLARCVTCMLAFCTKCDQAWHGGMACQSMEDMIADVEKSMGQGASQRESEKEKARKLHLLRQEMLSKDLVRRAAKRCPGCNIPIEKNGGCNKVNCSNCGDIMCWVCGKKIVGYNHFQSRCHLFPGMEVPNMPFPRAMAEGHLNVQAAIEDGNAVIKQCPRCRQRCLKENRNNHIRCWQCKTHFCYQCCSPITGLITDHFKASSPCQQHSD